MIKEEVYEISFLFFCNGIKSWRVELVTSTINKVN